MSILSRLRPPAGASRPRKRLGRGPGSGTGKTAGRGTKGQGARAGSGGKLFFEGGQMPLQRRIPKRGFTNVLAVTVANVNVGQLEDAFADGAEVTIEAMRQKRLLRGRFDLVKVLGNGSLNKRLTVQAHGFSAGARAKIEQAGGTVAVLGRGRVAPTGAGEG